MFYGHFQKLVPIGSQVQAGQVIGRQEVLAVQSYDGTIASIDFLAPAPKGSTSMVPYANYQQLRERIAQQLRIKTWKKKIILCQLRNWVRTMLSKMKLILTAEVMASVAEPEAATAVSAPSQPTQTPQPTQQQEQPLHSLLSVLGRRDKSFKNPDGTIDYERFPVMVQNKIQQKL